jgi:predicted O-methyltransferase YrrM
MRPIVHFALWAAGAAAPETQTTAAERRCLCRYASAATVAVEIGAWHGVTTAQLKGAMPEGAKLFAVDPYFPGRLGFSFQKIISASEVRRSAGLATVRFVRCTGVEAASLFAGQRFGIDLVFVDGDHSYDGVSADWHSWSPLIRPGGFVALHDSRSTPERDIHDAGSARFTREVILTDPAWQEIEAVDSLTVVQKR